MKSTFLCVISLLLAAMTLLTACNTTPPVTDTAPPDTSAPTENVTDEVIPPTREIYEDLSYNVPEIQGADGKSSTVMADGERNAPDIVLEFSGESGVFAVSSAKAVELHDSSTCVHCGYVEESEGYILSTHEQSNSQAGITVTLASPVPISTVTGLMITYKSSKELSSSVFRVLASDATTTATFHNECPSLSGASKEFLTLDVNMTTIDKLADVDGNLSAFQLMFRNKENASVEVKEITICMNPEKLLIIDELEGNYFSRGDVTSAIASTIAERFESANVGAEITVTVDQYRQNNSKMDGSIRYNATATLNNGTTITGQGKVTIPHVSGAWLDNSNGNFGSSHDNLGQWQETFDPMGMVLLTGNSIKANEGISTAEYALIPADGDHTAEAVVWRAPHLLRMGDDAIEALFVNAWLDYAHDLVEGQRYRLLVRGVTKNDNYILHLDIPFTYSPLDQTVNDALDHALKTIEDADFICPADTPDKAAYITEQLSALLNDPTLEVRTAMLGEGVNSATVQVTVLSNAAVKATRLPAYTVDGELLTAVYGYEGDAMTSGILTFPYSVYEGSIQLLSPYDGDSTVSLASPEIIALWNTPMKVIESGKYPFKRGESCLPVPAELTWSDAAGGSKTYTVTVSKSLDLSDPIVLTSDECKAYVYNLEIGRKYYWQVTDGNTASQIYTFTTEFYPRFFALEGISNFRDVGGYITRDGRRVKQSMMFRSSSLNGATPEAKDYMVNTLGLKLELDIRGSGSAIFGKEVPRKVIAMQWYTHIFTPSNSEVVRQTISAFADPAHYPMNFHCAIGRDRTGTTAFLILGLLGVDEETLLREYYSSFLSRDGACDRDEFVLHIENIHSLMDRLKGYSPQGTLQEQIESYLLSVGVTEAEIASIRELLLEA